jgi:hypothetical protein
MERMDPIIQREDTVISVPREILWDYREAPEDLLWRLQRIADFFPRYGCDRETVVLLFENRNRLRLEPATRALIEEYQRAHAARA